MCLNKNSFKLLLISFVFNVRNSLEKWTENSRVLLNCIFKSITLFLRKSHPHSIVLKESSSVISFLLQFGVIAVKIFNSRTTMIKIFTFFDKTHVLSIFFHRWHNPFLVACSLGGLLHNPSTIFKILKCKQVSENESKIRQNTHNFSTFFWFLDLSDDKDHLSNLIIILNYTVILQGNFFFYPFTCINY